SLVISVDPEDRTVQLPEMEHAGDRLTTDGELRPVTVTDSRESDPGWDVSAQVADFSSESDSFGAELLGWTPLVDSVSETQNVTAGDPVESGLNDGDGLSIPRRLAAAEPGGGVGTAELGADLQLQVPLT